MRRQASTGTDQVVFTAPQIQEDEDKKMADVAATPAVHRPKAAVKTDLKDTITLTFAGDDKALFDKIEAAAKADERTPAKFLLIQIRKQFQ
jgi:hypothetical protein